MTLSITNRSVTSSAYYSLVGITNFELEFPGEKKGVLTESGRAEIRLLVVDPASDVSVHVLQTDSPDGDTVTNLLAGAVPVGRC